MEKRLSCRVASVSGAALVAFMLALPVAGQEARVFSLAEAVEHAWANHPDIALAQEGIKHLKQC